MENPEKCYHNSITILCEGLEWCQFCGAIKDTRPKPKEDGWKETRQQSSKQPITQLFNVLPYKPETKEAIVSKTGAIIPNYKNNAIETLKAIEAEAMVLSRTKKGNVETTEEYIGGGPIQSSIKDYYGK